MEHKTLRELAKEYAENIKVVNEQIDACRKAAGAARKSGRNYLFNKLCRNLDVLYSQRSELVETERHLRTYYDRAEVRRAG